MELNLNEEKQMNVNNYCRMCQKYTNISKHFKVYNR
jgi:hypothetical protein